MKKALYAGSFNPWHDGHADILKKALKLFDIVYVMQGHNPNKIAVKDKSFLWKATAIDEVRVETGMFNGLLSNVVKTLKPDALIRGLRNGHDLQYEMNLQYWNEDLGVDCPIVYFVCDRKLSHISSSAIRELESLKK